MAKGIRMTPGNTGKVLDLGCGSNKAPGALGADLKPHAGVDVVLDVKKPLPFPDRSFEAVRLSHIVEHVPDLVAFMAEVHRVLVPGGRVYIVTPHFSAAASYRDPTHLHHLSLFSFDVFCGEQPEDFVPFGFRFAMKRKRLVFGRKGRLGLSAWANRHPELYEQHLAFVLPALEVKVELSALK